MKILVIPSWYPSKNSPNNGSFFREQALTFVNPSNEVYLINGTPYGRKDYFNKDSFKTKIYNDSGMIVIKRNYPNYGISKLQPLAILVAYINYILLFRKFVKYYGKPDVIHVQSFYLSGYCFSIIAKKYHIPFIVTEHSSRVMIKKLSMFQKHLLKKVVETSNEFICVSKKLANSIQEMTGSDKEIKIIPNYLNDLFYYKPKQKSELIKFISVGNLIPSKGFAKVVDAFKMFHEEFPKSELHIVGDGYQKQEIDYAIHKYKLDKNIIMHGLVSRDTVANLMRDSDYFILASEIETFGVVYIEALASGLPVITQKNGGSNDIIKDDYGYLLDKSSVEEYYLAMKNIVNKSFDRSLISNNIINQYGINSFYKKLMNVYSKYILED